MEAVLLAGGYGTRLAPLTYTTPKPLLHVGGRPMLEYVLDRLPKEVDTVIVAVNWLHKQLEAYFEARPDDGRTYHVVREIHPLGTAGALVNCQSYLKSDDFFVLNGDILSDIDLEEMLTEHRKRAAFATISLRRVPKEDTVHFGVAQVDEQLQIHGFVEKPASPKDAPSDLINAGAYLLSREVLRLIPSNRMVSMEQEIFPVLTQKTFVGVPFEGKWIDVGTPQRLREAGELFELEAWHGEGAKIGGHVYDSQAGRNLTVGAGAVVTGCILGNDVTIASGVQVSDCVIGDGATVKQNLTSQGYSVVAKPKLYPDKQVGNAIQVQ